MTVDCSRAERVGLRTRPLAETIADTARWLAGRDDANAWRHVLPAELEQRLVSL